MAAKTKKTTKKRPSNASKKKNGSPTWIEQIRKVTLGTVGAGKWVQESTVDDFLQSLQDFTQNLVEWGEVAEKDGKKLVREIRDRRKKIVTGLEGRIEKSIDKSLERILGTFGIPTKKDVDTLSSRVETLTKKFDSLMSNGKKSSKTTKSKKKPTKKK